jgi:NADPH-dependent curcumin reductase CurA
MGLLDIGQPKPGETVVVAAATGAVGSVVGQIAKLKECRVVGIAGGAEKCRYAVEELGLDVCLDHRSPKLHEELATACPKGIDVYYENVGGLVFDAVLPLLNARARIPLCGLIANYNGDPASEGKYRTSQVMTILLKRRIRVQGFIIFDDYGSHFGEFRKQMTEWFRYLRRLERKGTRTSTRASGPCLRFNLPLSAFVCFGQGAAQSGSCLGVP